MFDRRDLLFASATALTTSLVIQSTPTLAQSVTVPGTKRGFVERPGCRIYYDARGRARRSSLRMESAAII